MEIITVRDVCTTTSIVATLRAIGKTLDLVSPLDPFAKKAGAGNNQKAEVENAKCYLFCTLRIVSRFTNRLVVEFYSQLMSRARIIFRRNGAGEPEIKSIEQAATSRANSSTNSPRSMIQRLLIRPWMT